ncbi:MAG TPA: outer membrane beta-barrel protein [Stellaceae bacterium]|nr:outer membrane beta-barrel protein [Stellaceae bacterium]
MRKISVICAVLCGALWIISGGIAAAQSPSGVYIRGDLGGAFGNNTTFTDTNPGASNCLVCSSSITGGTGSSVIFGGGVGYRFTPMFRSDVTLDYIPSFKETGRSSVSTTTTSGNIDSLVVLANGYLDLNGVFPNVFGNFQPYLDAGIGFSNNHVGTTSFNALGAALSVSGNTKTDFAWAIGAGLGYSITPSTTLDVAYRYLDLGQAQTGTRLSGPGGSVTITAARGGLSTHIVTAGLRYEF